MARRRRTRRCGGQFWPVAALGLVGAGWLTFLLVQSYTARLMDEYGPATDVCDSLGRAAFVNRRTQPYYALMVALDGLAATSLFAGSQPGWSRGIKVVAVVLVLPSLGLHSLLWVIGSMFAA